MSKQTLWHWSFVDQSGQRWDMESHTLATDAEFKRQTENECKRNGWALEKMEKQS